MGGSNILGDGVDDVNRGIIFPISVLLYAEQMLVLVGVTHGPAAGAGDKTCKWPSVS